MSIIIEQRACPNCGGPLSGLMSSYITCPYCASEFYLPAMPGFKIPKVAAGSSDSHLAALEVGNARFRVHGRLARGEHSDVFLARRDRALTEMVLLKIARDEEGAAALRREWETLARVRAADSYLARLNPRPIALEMTRRTVSADRLAAVYGWRSGFIFTFAQARAQCPDGVDPRAAVWMWNRLLDQIACLESAGFSHNGITPEHLLIHPRDHGVALCGWSSACGGQGKDLALSGLAVASLLGKSAPAELRALADDARLYPHAVQLKEKLTTVAEALFGAPKFHTFTLTGGPHGIR